ncbi:hypothetical protein P7D31_00250 [Enterococcus dongliensis]|nr:hypothetical protein [Enterococcus dongliensis]MDT2614033.1 hypothetical protein [Enterococcus dongliensis]MDT2638544.1 hypothetical protein [Enterococcus dongliensis]
MGFFLGKIFLLLGFVALIGLIFYVLKPKHKKSKKEKSDDEWDEF